MEDVFGVVCTASSSSFLFFWRYTLPRNILRMKTLRALPIARPVPSPNCPLTAVCKLTSGTRPRDARSLLRRDLAADGRHKLSHSEVQRLILSHRPCPGSARRTLWLACGSHVVSDGPGRGGAGGRSPPEGGGTRACARGGGAVPPPRARASARAAAGPLF